MIARSALCLALLGSAAPVAATPLDLSGLGQMTAERHEGPATVALPVGAFHDGSAPTELAEGAVTRTAWRLRGGNRTPVQILQPIRTRLAEEGFETIFECADIDCGGFDFRYSTEILPEPAMHVDLGDFEWLTARRTGPDGATEHVAVIASRSASAGFVHVTQIGPSDDEERPQRLTLSTRNAADPFVTELVEAGHASLDDLTFGTGAATLGGQEFRSLKALADWLSVHPGQNVTLVGHTDSQGALNANIALSEARAAAVRDRLVSGLGVDPAQVQVLGLGPSEPRASNDTAEGRRLNRRVEVQLD